MINITEFRILTLAAASLILANCGGGGGGDGDFVGAARVVIQASPQSIDSGDRTEVKVGISDLHPNGISLKIRFPKGLDYVTASSFIEIDDSDIDITPTVNQEKGSDVYLVYYISPDILDEEDRGTLFFELEGKDEIEEGSIEVDPDVDDPDIDNSTEFNIDDPQFGAEGEVSIEVRD
jgi:hypothetical protein